MIVRGNFFKSRVSYVIIGIPRRRLEGPLTPPSSTDEAQLVVYVGCINSCSCFLGLKCFSYHTFTGIALEI